MSNSAWLAFVLGVAGAVVAWIASGFVGGPIRKFFDLRGEVIRRLTEFANVRARWKEVPDNVGTTSGEREEIQLSPSEITRLEEAQRTLRDLASQLRAFGENELLAMWLLKLRYDPLGASAGLIGLSNTCDTYGREKAFHRKTVEKALCIMSLPTPV